MSEPVNRDVGAGSGESFLGRWSRRKRAEPEKREVEDTRVADEVMQQRAVQQRAVDLLPSDPAHAGAATVPADLPAIEGLTPESDYSRFMKPDVPFASRNAAMKKLFTDPHFNVMDGLDTYIDDYTKEDPIPESMLRGLAQSRMLKLFNYDKEDAEDAEKARLAAQQRADERALESAAASDPKAAVSGTLAPQEAGLAAESPEFPALQSSQQSAITIGIADRAGSTHLAILANSANSLKRSN